MPVQPMNVSKDDAPTGVTTKTSPFSNAGGPMNASNEAMTPMGAAVNSSVLKIEFSSEFSEEKKTEVWVAPRRGELVALVFEFLGAATGSTATCIEWTLAHLIDQPEVQDKLRREIDGEANASGGILSSKSLRSGSMPYLNAVVLETLRMHPPVPFILRSAHGEGAKEIGGVTFPVPADGLKVVFNLGDMGRNRKTWTDPDKFWPERFLAGGEAEDVGPAPGPKAIRMMPFGAGHRNCTSSASWRRSSMNSTLRNRPKTAAAVST
nr:cytochrome P450 77A3-like [Aegilops tauschii subsp. strangulata]